VANDDRCRRSRCDTTAGCAASVASRCAKTASPWSSGRLRVRRRTDGFRTTTRASSTTTPTETRSLHWEDAVGGLTATQSDSGSMPIFDADGINANPALRFDGGHWLEVGLYDQMLSQPYTIVVVVAQYESVGEAQSLRVLRGGHGQRALLDLNRTGAGGVHVLGGYVRRYLTQPNDENTHVFTCVADGAASVFAWTTRVTRTLGPRGKRLTIGADSSGGGRGMSGWIGELLVYDRSLSQSERDDGGAYLSHLKTGSIRRPGDDPFERTKSRGVETK